MVRCINCNATFYDRKGMFGKKLCDICRSNPFLKKVRRKIRELGRPLTREELKQLED